MGKNLHNQERSSRKGILTENEKKSIDNRSISSKDISELRSMKTKRSLTRRLNTIYEDLGSIFDNERFYLWYTDIHTLDVLDKIRGRIEQHSAFQEIPEYRIASIMSHEKHMFKLKPINLNKNTKGNLKDEKRKKSIRGLKENEKKIILEYIDKMGFSFPLDPRKEYSWMEVKKILVDHLKSLKIPKKYLKNKLVEKPQMSKEIRNEFSNRMNKAKKMINSQISKEEQQKIINETGFGIKLIQYKQSL